MIRTSSTVRALSSFPFDPGAFNPSTSIAIIRYGYSSDTPPPSVSFVVPVHNQQARIRVNLQSIVDSATLAHELVIIVDAPTDDTLAAVTTWADELQSTRTIGVTIGHAQQAIFETIADSVGFELSVGATIVEIQADMTISHPGFDARFADALAANPDVVAISGRGAHAFSLSRPANTRMGKLLATLALFVHRRLVAGARRRGSYSPRPIELRLASSIGRVGDLVELTAAIDPAAPLILHDTIMRGPLALDRVRFDRVGRLDTSHFFLGYDDHDLAMRAWTEHRLRCGYLPISFESPLDAGTTRMKRSPAAEAEFARLRSHYEAAFADSALGRNLANPPTPPRIWRSSSDGSSAPSTSNAS